MTITTSREARTAFWPTVALCALMLCAWMACTRGGSVALADNGGAATGGLIAMMGINPAEEHLYLIDTDRKVIMMYEAENNRDLMLVAGRSYDADSLFITKHPNKVLPFRAKPYSATEVAALLKAFARP